MLTKDIASVAKKSFNIKTVVNFIKLITSPAMIIAKATTMLAFDQTFQPSFTFVWRVTKYGTKLWHLWPYIEIFD
jgi:hypothetical protein